MLIAAVLLFAGTAVGLALVDVVVARHRAAAAADLAALAGAQRWPEGPSASCTAAWRVARAQETRLERCEVHRDGSVDVMVSAELGSWLRSRLPDAGGSAARARARAGPAAAAGGVA